MAQKGPKSRRDPAHGMGRTHFWPPTTTLIDTGTVFPARTKEVTFALTLKITAADPAGVAFELGSAATGVAIWIAAADRKLYAAVGDAAANDGVTLTGPVTANGQLLRVVLAVIPQTGKARLWVNGNLVAYGTAVNGALPNGWSDGAAGRVADVSGAVTTRVGVADRIALAGASVVSNVDAYNKQRPRQFFEVA